MLDERASRYRVFISYSHRDEQIVRVIEDILRAGGLVPMRDKHFTYGVGFHGQIQRFIEHAHLFMPIITERSSQRGWVQQEIGYAMSQNVPVLPVAIAKTPGEWIQSLHAIVLRAPEWEKSATDDEIQSAIAEILPPLAAALARREDDHCPRLVDNLVQSFVDEHFANYECAYLQEERTAAITDHANDVYSIQVSHPDLNAGDEEDPTFRENYALSSFVRQRGGLSSFHIPDKPISDEVWTRRYGTLHKSEHHCKLQREERRALTRHAAEWGARIVINPQQEYGGYGHEARVCRLECLKDFLASDEVPHLEVAIDPELSSSESVTVVGSWFRAQSVTANSKQGYYQTILTRHAPSMKAWIRRFDEEFIELLKAKGWRSEDSKRLALAEVEKELKEATKPLASEKKKLADARKEQAVAKAKVTQANKELSEAKRTLENQST